MDQSNRPEPSRTPPVDWTPPTQPAGIGSLSDFAPYPTEPIVATPPRRKGSTALNVLLGLAAIIAIGGVAFAAGRVTAPAAASTTGGTGGTGRFPAGSFAPGAGGFRGGAALSAAALHGTVTAMTPTAITLTVGQTEITVSTNGSTTYHQQAAGAASDVAVGSTVLVQLNDANGTGLGGGGFGGGARASLAPGATAAPITLGPATDVTVESK